MNPALRPDQRPDQRKEPRRAAEGAVRVWFDSPRPLEIRGTLVDLSSGGFRMAHTYLALEAGQKVEFSHLEATGRARVVWNRVAGARVETGFLVEAG